MAIVAVLFLSAWSVKAEIYYNLTGTVTMGYTEVSTEIAKPQADRWITAVSFPGTNTSGRCSSVASTFNLTSSRSLEFWLAKCDNITINANIASGRGLTVSVDGTVVYTINGNRACTDWSYNVNKEVPCKIKVTATNSSSAYVSLFKFSYEPKVPQIASFTAESVSAKIDQNAKTITANLPFGTDLSNITPVVTLNSIATSYYPTGAVDFTNSATIPVVYTATDGVSATTNYNVTLTANKNTENTISNLKIDNIVPIFDAATNTYTLVLPKGTTDLTKTVTFDLPFRATADFTSGNSNNFTNPLKIKVTAENGDQKEYTLNVFAATKSIAYVINTAVDAKDIKIRPMLASKYYLENIPIANVTTTYDFSAYDMVILTEAPSSGSVGMKALWGINKPLLSLKIYAIQGNTWNLSTASNPVPSVTTVTVNEPNHPIFNGVKFSGIYANEIQMFNAISSGNGVQTSPYAGNYNIANIKGALTTGILELPVGTQSLMTAGSYTNELLQQKLLIVSLSNDNQNIVTDNALKIIDNAVNYLTGATTWGTDAGTEFKNIPPTGYSVVTSNVRAILYWDAIPGAVKYIISKIGPATVKGINYVKSDVNAEVDGSITEYELLGLTQGTEYTYQVVGQNALGTNSAPKTFNFITWWTGVNNAMINGVTFDGKIIHNADHQLLNVFDATGRLIINSREDINMSAQAKGVYLVKGENGMMKIAVTK